MQLQASPILNFWTCKSSKRFLFPKFIVSKTRIESRRIAFSVLIFAKDLKISQSGKISPNLITLLATVPRKSSGSNLAIFHLILYCF